MSKLLLFVFTTFFSSFASAENAKLNNVIEEQKMYCKSAVLNGEFKGEKIVGFDLSKEDYFVVSEEATEELVISTNGQKALFFYPHETTCAGKSMNDFCGSSGCSYSFIINEKSYDAHGFGPFTAQNDAGEIFLMIGRSGGACGVTPNSQSCVQAFVWDEQYQSLNSFK